MNSLTLRLQSLKIPEYWPLESFENLESLRIIRISDLDILDRILNLGSARTSEKQDRASRSWGNLENRATLVNFFPVIKCTFFGLYNNYPPGLWGPNKSKNLWEKWPILAKNPLANEKKIWSNEHFKLQSHTKIGKNRKTNDTPIFVKIIHDFEKNPRKFVRNFCDYTYCDYCSQTTYTSSIPLIYGPAGLAVVEFRRVPGDPGCPSRTWVLLGSRRNLGIFLHSEISGQPSLLAW